MVFILFLLDILGISIDLKRRLYYESIMNLDSFIFLIGVNQMGESEVRELIDDIVLPMRRALSDIVHKAQKKDKNIYKSDAKADKNDRQAKKEENGAEKEGHIEKGSEDILKIKRYLRHRTKNEEKQGTENGSHDTKKEVRKRAHFKSNNADKKDGPGVYTSILRILQLSGSFSSEIETDLEEIKHGLEKRNRLFELDQSQTAKEMFHQAHKKLIKDFESTIHSSNETIGTKMNASGFTTVQEKPEKSNEKTLTDKIFETTDISKNKEYMGIGGNTENRDEQNAPITGGSGNTENRNGQNTLITPGNGPSFVAQGKNLNQGRRHHGSNERNGVYTASSQNKDAQPEHKDSKRADISLGGHFDENMHESAQEIPQNPSRKDQIEEQNQMVVLQDLSLDDSQKQDAFYLEMMETLERAITESDNIEKIKKREVREFNINLTKEDKNIDRIEQKYKILFNLGCVFLTPSIFISISKGIFISDKSIFIEKMIYKILQPILTLTIDNSNGTDTEKKENILIFMNDIVNGEPSKYKDEIDDAYKSRSDILEKYFNDQSDHKKDLKIRKIDIELEKRNKQLLNIFEDMKAEHFRNFSILNHELVNSYTRFILTNNERDKKSVYDLFNLE